MTTNELNALIPQVIKIAKQAGKLILPFYEEKTDIEVTLKEDQSPLTKADLLAHNAIMHGLSSLTLDLPILSEEAAVVTFSERAQWSRYWLVDPLDGTKEFINKRGNFTVNIALIDDHCPILGVVYVPVSDTVYFACSGHGAFRAQGDEEAKQIQVKKCLSDKPFNVLASRLHRGEDLESYLNALPEHECVSIGSSLKICYVAEGKADIYPRFQPTSEWDTAAAQAVLENAGGFLTNFSGNPLRYNKQDSLINSKFLAFGDPDIDWYKYLPKNI